MIALLGGVFCAEAGVGSICEDEEKLWRGVMDELKGWHSAKICGGGEK
jgi:hypothetical protein